jgi:hypothetical protein
MIEDRVCGCWPLELEWDLLILEANSSARICLVHFNTQTVEFVASVQRCRLESGASFLPSRTGTT